MHINFLCVMYLLVALMSLHQTSNANGQIQLSNIDAEISLEAFDQGPSDQTDTSIVVDQVRWDLWVWQGDWKCPGSAKRKWSGKDIHACEEYKFNELSFKPDPEGTYRFCAYSDSICDKSIYDTTKIKECQKFGGVEARSWKVIKPSEKCHE